MLFSILYYSNISSTYDIVFIKPFKYDASKLALSNETLCREEHLCRLSILSIGSTLMRLQMSGVSLYVGKTVTAYDAECSAARMRSIFILTLISSIYSAHWSLPHILWLIDPNTHSFVGYVIDAILLLYFCFLLLLLFRKSYSVIRRNTAHRLLVGFWFNFQWFISSNCQRRLWKCSTLIRQRAWMVMSLYIFMHIYYMIWWWQLAHNKHPHLIQKVHMNVCIYTYYIYVHT